MSNLVYQLHRLEVRLQVEEDTVREAASEALQSIGVKKAGGSNKSYLLHFSSSRQSLAIPPHAHEIRSEDNIPAVYATKDRLYLQHARSVAEIAPHTRKVWATVDLSLSAEQRQLVTSYFTIYGLALLLQYDHWYVLHAAGLSKADRRFLIAARSDNGKSTLAYALVREGWNYLSDDAVLLHLRNQTVKAFSYRKEFALDSVASQHFPELAGREWPPMLSDENKWRINVDEVYPNQALEVFAPNRLLFPSLTQREESTVVPIATKRALGKLIDQSIILLSLRPENAQEHLHTLRRLLTQTQSYRLEIGRDVLEEPKRFAAFMEAI